jgi:Glycosyl transferase family 2
VTSTPEVPGVSFVVPVYNKAPHLPRVLEQIARQQGDFRRQYVFVDDGSTDGSLDILRDVTRGWENLVIETQPNAGSAATTNRGIALARESFVKFVDADDLLGDHATAMLLKTLRDSDACLVYGRAVRYGPDDVLDLDFSAASPVVTRIDAPLRPAIRNAMFNPTQFLVRTEAVKAVGGCDERVVFSQEYGLTLRLARRWPFLCLDAPVAWLPQEAPGRLSSNEGRQLQRVTQALALFLADHPDLAPEIRRFACRRSAGRAYKYARRRGGEPTLGRWFWRHLAAQLGLVGDAAGFVAACCDAFRSAEAAAPSETVYGGAGG